MKSTTWLCMTAALAVVCSGCGDSAPSNDERGAAGTGGAPAASGPSCDSGQQSCHCPDGTMTGLQLCNPSTGALLPCSCYTPPAEQPSDEPVDAPNAPGAQEVTRVCAALEGTHECDASSYESDEIPAGA